MSGDYDVGYGKPPQHTRFRKGQSGNPTGRPKGARNLKTDLMEELQEQILVREGGRQKHVSKQRAMLKSLTAKAVQGDTKAASVILGIVYRLFHADEGEDAETPIPAEDLAILKNLRERLVESRLPKAAKPSRPKKTKE